jgi:hypothetical protein
MGSQWLQATVSGFFVSENVSSVSSENLVACILYLRCLGEFLILLWVKFSDETDETF